MNRILYVLFALAICGTAMAQNTVTITDADLLGGQTYNWTSDNVYELDGYVFLEEGGVLNIAPGTVIKGKTVPSNGDQTSALIITKGAQIFAEGTAQDPIIFTGEIDDLTTTTDLTADDNQTWGGLIILGNSIVGEDGGTDVIEGIPSDEPRIIYGGDDPMDNSGTLTYVSIRHGGSVIGADNEINGLTLGGVGAGTTIDYVEVFANKDDGIELFGGTVNITHAVVAFAGDDSFDFDESYEGYLQFLFSIQGTTGDNAIEYDGSERADAGPKTVGRLYNGTFIGSADLNASSDGLRLRNDGAAQLWNCVFVDQPGYAYRFDNDPERPETAVAGNFAFNFGVLVNTPGTEPETFLVTEADPQLAGISRSTDGGLDPRPNAGSPLLFAAIQDDNSDDVARVPYSGAFGNADNWAMGWTAVSQYGYFGDLAETAIATITDADIEAGDTLTLTADNEWLLDGYVYVEEGACLVIEPGTVVKGKTVPTTGDLTSSLIVARGGKIIADGTADAPIIFTGELDDLSTTTDLTADDNQTWGGLIILGNSIVGEENGTDVIEGIPSDEPRIIYGGTDSLDNSGILRYVSIRHGGSVLGADNEINGLTMGGVGAGTIVDYVEVFANKDDGIELFGGTVNITHAVVGFAGDDSFDFDESYEGYLQFLFSIQGTTGDNAIEYDGSERADAGPKTVGRLYNGTFIGSADLNASSDGLRLRNDGAAQLWNCVFVDQPGYAYRFDNDPERPETAVAGNFAFNFGVLVNTPGTEPETFLVTEADPELAGISRSTDGGLDPRPDAGSPLLFAAIQDNNSDDVARVPYSGAFGNSDNWAMGWTAMSQYGYFGDLAETAIATITDADIEAGDTLTLTADNEWLLDGYVYVEEGACLVIEPGTVVKGKTVPTTGDLTSSLIVARGGKIIADGTADAPIIFTGELDDLSTTTDLTADDNQTWGGLIILGNSIVGEENGTDVIEGIPSDEPRIIYGGDDPMDNSGILRYVSIRHGGSVLGADNEINGLTMGGVGAGTIVDYVEVFANKDDGIELFGGTVNITHAVVGFAGDDSFDFDESYEGYLQFLFSIQGTTGDNAIEYDGSERADAGPKTVGRLYNGTFIGSADLNASSDGLRLRNDGAAQLWNCVFVDQPGYAYRFDNDPERPETAVAGNFAFNFGVLVNTPGTEPETFLVTEADPELAGISRSTDGGLDPRPDAGSPLLFAAIQDDNSDDVARVPYSGAFSNAENWALGWTAMDEYGYFGDLAETAIATITDADIEAGDTLTLTADNEWLLDGYVYVEEGACLVIEPGTVVKGKTVPTTGDLTSSLIVARGGKIIADGTADAPIIFTGELDDLSTTTDLTADDNQTWGGLIILGNSIVGEENGTDVIEGIPSDEPRIIYGGTDSLDNSGILRYVSIRHGGSVLGADNEINGLTMGGVGAGTIVDYVEVFANKDDGIELFGGTVNITHAVVGFAGDDSFDFDESYEGTLQFIFSVQGNTGDNAIEYDGSERADAGPKTVGKIYNGTFIGSADLNASSDGLRLRNDGAAQLWNCIFVDQPGYAYRFDNDPERPETAVAGNFAFNFGVLVNTPGTEPETFLVTEADPQLAGISRSTDGGLDPRPNAGSPVLFSAIYGDDDVAEVPYAGAFSNAENWAEGWTAMSQYGYFGDLAETAIATIRDEDIEAGDTLTLTADNEWLLDGYVYVEETACLVIEPGTVVKGKTVPSTGDLTSALIVARGGKIIADGTADAPIIFTGELDDLSTTTDLTADDNQTWGGLIILGNSIVGEENGTDVIEGIPSDEPRIIYGGTDSLDNSGILRYVSIRHGGSVLGADNEINGLTLGGVGAGTTIDYVEVFANKDDGIELFGGTVNITHAVVGFAGDDSFDFDESYEGTLQFIFSLQGTTGDNAIEYDGSERADAGPKTVGKIYNGTFIGSADLNASSDGLRLRNDGAAQLWNCVFADQPGYAYRFDNDPERPETAVAANIAFNFGVLVNTPGTEPATFLVEEVDPTFGGISRVPDGGLDPRHNAGSPALGGAVFGEGDNVEEVFYRGAFGCENWAEGWTAMSQYGYFGDLATCSVNTYELNDNGVGVNTYPNPADQLTATVGFELPQASEVTIKLYDMQGKIMGTVDLGRVAAGSNNAVLNTGLYQSGLYIVAVETEFGTVTQKITILNRK